MKKILITFLCIFLITGTLCPAVLADEPLKIVSGSILNGELDAEVSPLLQYEFSEEIAEPSYEDITVLPATIGEISVSGKKLTLRLAAAMAYNTEHILDLSKLTSMSGKKLSEAESKIKFMTKYGESLKIFEDDFETGTLSGSWRSASNVIVQKEGDNGNFSYKVGTTNFDNFVSGKTIYTISGDSLLGFDIMLDTDTVTGDYYTMLFSGHNGLSDKDTNYKKIETKRLLGYDYETGKFGVLFNTTDSGADFPSAPIAGKVLNEGWNSILIWINSENQTLKLYVNGEMVEDDGGNSDFAFPFVASATGTLEECSIYNIRYQGPGTNYGGGSAEAGIYYDNISYREVVAPFLASSSINNGDTVSLTCPKLDLTFRNFPQAVELSLNDVPIAEGDIIKNNDTTFTIFPELSWNESYTLTGKVSGSYGNSREISLNFSTGSQPANLIETVGYFDGSGQRITGIQSGEITAKVKFWQSTSQSYVLLATCYKEIDGRLKMMSISAPVAFTTENALEEKSVTVTVPADYENCFVEYSVLYDSLSRIPYESNLFSDDQILR